jgi:aldose 1-epimerase
LLLRAFFMGQTTRHSKAQSVEGDKTMTALIELATESMRCHIAPALGGCVTGLWLGDTPVLRSVPDGVVATARLSGSYALVPFSNRVGHATLKWNGTAHPLVRNNGEEPHAIHGVGWQRQWQVLESDAQFALLSFEHRPDASWPFAFDASQAFRLKDNALEVTLSITNQSNQPAPVGLGWHPYFVKRTQSHVRFQASGRWELDGEMLPTHRTPVKGITADAATLKVDHCFDGWPGVVHLHDEVLHTRITSNLSRLVVFTNDSKDFVAIEPVSHVNNALNMLADASLVDPADYAARAAELGVQVLQPGESLSVEMTIHAEYAA